MKSDSNIDRSQQQAAKVAGFSFLFSMVIMIIPFYAITLRLIVPGDVAETARNISAHETLFRLNIATDIVNIVNMVLLLSALYIIFKPINRILALITSIFRFIYASMWGITVLTMMNALGLMGNESFLTVFRTEQLQTLMRLELTSNAYYIGLPFWALASVICCYLWFVSGYIPRILAGIGVIVSAWAVICAFAYMIYPDFAHIVSADLFDFPLYFFEFFLGFWLLFKGLNLSKQPDTAHPLPES